MAFFLVCVLRFEYSRPRQLLANATLRQILIAVPTLYMVTCMIRIWGAGFKILCLMIGMLDHINYMQPKSWRFCMQRQIWTLLPVNKYKFRKRGGKVKLFDIRPCNPAFKNFKFWKFCIKAKICKNAALEAILPHFYAYQWAKMPVLAIFVLKF